MKVTATLIMQVATVFVLVAMGMPMALLHILAGRRLNANHSSMRTRLAHAGEYQTRQEKQQQDQIAKAVAKPMEHIKQPG
ncbi:hypothetical protein DQ400_19810 [Vreelandella sulfidaeris]|uniref:Uncharacterized protein n=1 Tax=Vreelandella sulfidaeris TaxID=115553 RepID=A0A365THT4_9GAMM|nr:hypothetical protein DQ400_19810 [Halomonas sulfidaeris]